ncbi:MAG TPA: hypothetical protein VFZ36_01165 [Vicinamibacterales bacterium]
MEAAAPLVTLALVLLILVSSVRAIRRDPRFDRREILVQVAWIAAYLLAGAGVALAMMPAGRRIGALPAALVAVAWFGLSMIVLARYLQKRLGRRSSR